MLAVLALFAVLGVAASSPAVLLRFNDDGQWHPELDGSIVGSGALRWGLEDGSWKPELDGSWLGRGDLAWLNRRKRDVFPTTLSHPADEPITAQAKNDQLRQQHTEGTRNILGGGIPLDLPADTPEVAAAKQAHAVAHENEKLATGTSRYVAPVTHVTHVAAPVAARVVAPFSHIAAAPVTHVAHVATPIAAPVAHVATPVAATRVITPVAHVAAPVARVVSPYHYAHPYSYAALVK